MADAKKVIIGQRMDRFPGATWNALVEGELKRRGNKTPSGGPTATQFSPAIIQIIWDEDSELTPGSAVALREAMIDPADDASAPYNGIVFHAETPAAGDVDSPRIAIATSPILAQYGVGSAVMPNCVWAKVDVVDAADTHAGAVSGQLSLESGTTGQYPIVWKKATGTGVQWAVVAMGTSSAAGSIVIGQVTAAVASDDPTFDIDNIALISGVDPRTDPDSASETLQVLNTLELDLIDNRWVYAIKNLAGDWDSWGDAGIEEIDVVTDITGLSIAGGNLVLTFTKGTYKVISEVTAAASDTVTIAVTECS